MNNKPTEVIVLGTLHGRHYDLKKYSLKTLEDIIKNIKPDFILAEIPKKNFLKSKFEFEEKGTISDERLNQFPEYTEVVFPLAKSLDFEIIPCSAWTEEMAIKRQNKLIEIENDPSRKEDWIAYENAQLSSRNILSARNLFEDVAKIHTDEFDKTLNIELSVYNKLFNEELEEGGWDNINKAHFALIEEALDRDYIKGKRVLITFGAGHKGWFINALKKRKDIHLKNLLEVL